MGSKWASVIIIVLVTVTALPFAVIGVQRMRETSQRTEAVNHLRKISLSLHSCNDVHKGLPPAFDSFGDLKTPASVHVHLLPFLEQAALYRSFVAESGNEAADVEVYRARLDYSNERDKKGVQNFAANLRVFADAGFRTNYEKDMPDPQTIEPGTARIPHSYYDGTSNTVVFTTKLANGGNGGSRFAANPTSPFAAFVGQNAARRTAHPSDPTATFQLQPKDTQCVTRPLMAQSLALQGILVGLGDGSVRVLAPETSPKTWNQFMQPNDGVPLSNGDW